MRPKKAISLQLRVKAQVLEPVDSNCNLTFNLEFMLVCDMNNVREGATV